MRAPASIRRPFWLVLVATACSGTLTNPGGEDGTPALFDGPSPDAGGGAFDAPPPDLAPAPVDGPPATVLHWYRGNTHTHAQLSDTNDTDDTPTIAGWYQAAGYDFLLISEHNDHLATKQIFCHDELTTSSFLMMCGLELSYDVHTTALGIERYILEETSLQDAVTRTLDAGGVAILNHPAASGIQATDFLATAGLSHFEVVNGGRLSDTASHEALWDAILSDANGRLAYGVASDDNHYSESNVGRGWIMVRAAALTRSDLLTSVRAGDFYASTGVILDDYQVDPSTRTIHIGAQNGDSIVFLGRDGAELQRVTGSQADYQVDGTETYVRAKITNSAGEAAWTQPLWVSSFP